MREHIISKVDPGSIAEEMEIEAGDVLLAINGKEIRDIFDYRMQMQRDVITVLIRKGERYRESDAPDIEDVEPEEWELEIEKDPF